jgi:tetraacyldisaccharide 4'-kinase
VKRLDEYWWDRNGIAFLLLPLSWLFCLVVVVRKIAYRLGIIQSTRLPVPVIVVGNISVGGTGKTPLVIWIARYLKSKGYKPGIISRGYGGQASSWPQQVREGSDPVTVGDEAILIANHTGCPMCVGPDRAEAGRALVENTDCDIVISDDGMQHYGLQRDIEIAVIDGERGLGNGFCLPAGPLRERPKRLAEVDMVVANGPTGRRQFRMQLRQIKAINLADSELEKPLSDFVGKEPVHVVAGIGNPERFFSQLENAGIRIIRHPFPDHHLFSSDDIPSDDGRPVLMTEKDAVKCCRFAESRHWLIRIEAVLEEKFAHRLDVLIKGATNG